jgi:hypothetical protein
MAPGLKFMMEGLMDLQAGQWEVAASGGGFQKDTSKKVNEAGLKGHKVSSDDYVPKKDSNENKGDETKKEEDVSPQ